MALPAWGQTDPPASSAQADSCPLQARYPLPTDPAALRALADRQSAVAGERPCLKSATFHAWRGATLLALGQAAEAVEPLERALLEDPDLPGAQLDLAQALALQGDSASARTMLAALRQRADLPGPIALAIDRQLLVLQPAPEGVPLRQGQWQHRIQLSSLVGADSNLNNAPANSEITLTFPQGNVTLPLDASSLPQRGAAMQAAVQWQGLRPHGEALWLLQADLRARHTADSGTRYQQLDLAASWLQAPAAPRQWVARLATSRLQYGGSGVLQTSRALLQYQWDTLGHIGDPAAMPADVAGCRPVAAAELEHRSYPFSRGLDGLYQGAAFGFLCRGNGRHLRANGTENGGASQSFYSLQARLGNDHPAQDARPGGSYRRAEIKAQWDGPLMSVGRLGVQWTTTRQVDDQPYAALLGNLPRRTTRHVLGVEGSWPIAPRLSVVGNAEASLQRSNLAAFVSRQRSVYLGLRWELTQ
jgi:hypothetical protein